MIRLTTLGAARLDDTVAIPLAPKRVALVSYLALARPRGPHRRDTLLGLFWPEVDQRQARAALRQALHGLRATLGPGIVRTSGMELVDLNRDALACDLWSLEAAVAAGEHAAVLELFQGELLAGLFVTGAPAFDEWLDGERARVRDLVSRAASAHAMASARSGRAGDVARAVRVRAALAPFDETATREGMSLLAGLGERATAVDVYERFVDRLRRELDTDPAPETQALVARIKEHAPVVAARDAEVPMAAVDSVSTPPPSLRRRVRRWAATGFGAAVVATLAGASLARSAEHGFDPRRVAVLQYTNESGQLALDTLARLATFGSRDALSSMEQVRVVDGDAGERAGTRIRGTVALVGDSVQLRAEVLDVATGTVARSIVLPPFPRAGVRRALETFDDRLRAAVATTLYPGWGLSLSQPPSLRAYQLFVDGLRNIRLENHDAATTLFRRAFAEDSTFTAAGLLAAAELYQMRHFTAADSIVTAIDHARAQLPAVDARLLDWISRSLAGDRAGARVAMQAVTALAPQADLAWLQLAIEEMETGRPAAALAALDHIDPAADFGEGWASYWATRIETLHAMGEHARERAAARRGHALHPELSVLRGYELRAAAALGDIRAVFEGIEALSSYGPGTTTRADPPTTMRQVALELTAHGNAAAGARMLGGAMRWYATRPDSERATPQYRLGLARTAYLADDRATARAIYDSVLAAHPKCIDCRGALGVLAARGGEGAGAARYAAALDSIKGRFLFGRTSMWKARIAATLGDRANAARLLNAAFAAGAELDVLTHADPDLAAINPDSIYRAFAHAPAR